MSRSIRLLLPILATATINAAASGAGDSLAPSPGVSLALATQRAAQISDLRYELALSIPELRSEPVTGTNTLHFTLADPRRPLVIDFDPGGTHPLRVTANARTIAARQVNGHIVIAPGVLRRGANTVRIDFTAGDGPLNRADDLLYTLFVPAHARQALPCFDQPDLKGRWSVTVEHPAAWRAVANGAELQRRELGNRTRVRFAQTRPLPTYLVSLAVGKFQLETARRGGRVMRMFHRETDPAKLARNRDALFDLHAQSLAFMERYTGIKYQFGKFDFVLIPAFPFGGMEHAGDIHYRAESLLLEESATQRQLLARARVIAHETAHMWFGNLVTMKWFDDVWTKEVFANFMASKVADPLFPDLNHELQFFLDHHGDAYAVERSAGTNAIRQPLENLGDAGSLYGPIIYEKSPVVMRQLEALLGDEPFRDGLRGYLRRYSFGNANWDNLIEELAPRASTDLKAWSRAWIDEPGRALIATDMQVNSQGALRLQLQQTDPLGRDRLWPQQLRVTIGCNGERKRIVVELNAAVADLTARLGGCVPQYVLAGGEGWGYGEFRLDQQSTAYLLEHLDLIDDPLTRAVAWSALWESMLAGNLAPERLYRSALKELRSESDEQVVSAVLGDVRTLWWLFLSPEQREERAPALEELLRSRLAQAPSASLKAAWFGALRSVATTPAAIGWLRDLWQRQEKIAGLPLRETDETALAYELAVRGVADAPAILDQQVARISDPDRRARFEFVRPALAADALVREGWFRQLSEPANRRHEVWVAEGLRWMHHPLRAASSAPLVAPALAMVLSVNRTGNLFFDAAWLAAVLSGHSSPAIAQVVEQFVAQLPPDYPPRLRALVLQRSDLLKRAARFKPS